MQVSVKALRTETGLTLTERCAAYTRVTRYSIVRVKNGLWLRQSGSVCFNAKLPALPWNSGPVYGPYNERRAQAKLDSLLLDKLSTAGRRAAERSAAMRKGAAQCSRSH